jgi:hypothetical protein
MAQRLLVLQSLWAMERRHPDGVEWPLERKLAMIRDAGFDGAGVRFADEAHARQVTGFLREHGLAWQAQCYPATVEDLRPILDRVRALGPITSTCSRMCGATGWRSASPPSRAGGAWRQRRASRSTSRPIGTG